MSCSLHAVVHIDFMYCLSNDFNVALLFQISVSIEIMM